MPSLPVSSPLLLALFVAGGQALRTTLGSACASFCGGSKTSVSNTTVADIVCLDDAFDSSESGVAFEQCTTCLQTSKAIVGDENDLSWYLYNLRYALDVCLFSYPAPLGSSQSSQCTSSCGPIQSALETDILDVNGGYEMQYQYCTANNSSFSTDNVAQCTRCLQDTGNEHYLANFVLALQTACADHPTPGNLLKLDGTLFSTAVVGTSGTSSETMSTSTSQRRSLSGGVVAGIAIGIVVVVGSVVALILCLRRRRRQRAPQPYHYQIPPSPTQTVSTFHPGRPSMADRPGPLRFNPPSLRFGSRRSRRSSRNTAPPSPLPLGDANSIAVSPARSRFSQAKGSPVMSDWASDMRMIDEPDVEVMSPISPSILKRQLHQAQQAQLQPPSRARIVSVKWKKSSPAPTLPVSPLSPGTARNSMARSSVSNRLTPRWSKRFSKASFSSFRSRRSSTRSAPMTPIIDSEPVVPPPRTSSTRPPTQGDGQVMRDWYMAESALNPRSPSVRSRASHFSEVFDYDDARSSFSRVITVPTHVERSAGATPPTRWTRNLTAWNYARDKEVPPLPPLPMKYQPGGAAAGMVAAHLPMGSWGGNGGGHARMQSTSSSVAARKLKPANLAVPEAERASVWRPS